MVKEKDRKRPGVRQQTGGTGCGLKDRATFLQPSTDRDREYGCAA
jgi:hypothetical protein